MHCCRKFVISGRVQGVCYRASTQKKAIELELTGYVRNLPDGRVEAECCGTVENIEAMQQWFWSGPVMAKVIDVQIQPLPILDYAIFDVR